MYVCKFNIPAQSYNRARYGTGSGAVLLEDVFCTGSESRLDLCQHTNSSARNCGRSEDVGVRCE